MCEARPTEKGRFIPDTHHTNICHPSDIFPLMMKNAAGKREEKDHLSRAALVWRGGTSAAASGQLEEMRGRMASWLVNTHNWPRAWEERRKQMEACGLDRVTAHLTNFSSGLLPGFSMACPHFSRPEQGLDIGVQGCHAPISPYLVLQ